VNGERILKIYIKKDYKLIWLITLFKNKSKLPDEGAEGFERRPITIDLRSRSDFDGDRSSDFVNLHEFVVLHLTPAHNFILELFLLIIVQTDEIGELLEINLRVPGLPLLINNLDRFLADYDTLAEILLEETDRCLESDGAPLVGNLDLGNAQEFVPGEFPDSFDRRLYLESFDVREFFRQWHYLFTMLNPRLVDSL
jgi:hypothetical protein